jgi:hypothetical protein
MTGFGEMRGLLIFGLILLIIVIVSLAAYLVTGPMGIEARYSHAVGMPAEEEEPGGGWFGFSLEGNPLLYVVILVILGIICLAAYLRWRKQEAR